MIFLAFDHRVLYVFFRNLAISVLTMKHRPRSDEQDDLLRPRLIDLINPRHELVKLAALIEREWAGFFPSDKGRPAIDSRLVAGLLYLQHAYRLSDEAVVARWVENPYYQHFTGEVFFQHRPPIDPSSLTRWRGRIGEEGVEWLLTQTIRAGQKSGVIDEESVKRVAVDTTVMEKNIAYPTDARLYERARDQLVALAQKARVDLRQSYPRLAPRLALQVGRYAHAKQFKRMRKALKRLKGYTGRVMRDLRRHLQDIPKADCATRSSQSSPWCHSCCISSQRGLTRSTPCMNPKWIASRKARQGCAMSLAARSASPPHWTRALWSVCAALPATLTTATP